MEPVQKVAQAIAETLQGAASVVGKAMQNNEVQRNDSEAGEGDLRYDDTS